MNVGVATQQMNGTSLRDFFQIDCQWQQGPLQFLLARFDKALYQQSLFARAEVTYPASLVNAVAKRQAEYLAGRYSIVLLQRQLGLAQVPVHTAANRSPIWPSGQLGCISHTDGWVLAALQALPAQPRRAGAVASAEPAYERAFPLVLGLDAELLFSAEQQQSVAAMIHTQAELQLGLAAGLTACQFSTLVFSAKETLYKALSGHCQRVMEFSAARLVALSMDHFVLELTEHWASEWPSGRQLQGQYRWFGPLVCTWLSTAS